MRKFLLVAIVAAVGVLATALPGSAGSLTADQLESAGWTCFPVPGHGIHCSAPLFGPPPFGQAPAVHILYFDDTGTQFRGTETLIRADIFERRAVNVCPTEPGGQWFLLPFGYYACHHR